MVRSASLMIGLACLAAPLRAQDSQPAPVPATILLGLRDDLALDIVQVRRLRELEALQSAALAKANALFLRAEADVVSASEGHDPVVRRAALEKRAKVAIDAEVARMKWEKDARAILTVKQAEVLPSSIAAAAPRGTRPMLWRPLVGPLSLSVPAESVADSGEVRISVTPNYADIFVNGEKRGTGRRFLVLPVGSHDVELSAVNCDRMSLKIAVIKQQPTVVTQSLTCRK
jgi:hypothetical protein